jgi:hypothetical protein
MLKIMSIKDEGGQPERQDSHMISILMHWSAARRTYRPRPAALWFGKCPAFRPRYEQDESRKERP